jgi:hypothetical protein
MRSSKALFFSLILLAGGIVWYQFAEASGIQVGFPVLSRSGNTTGYMNFTGSFTNGNCTQTDANHNLIDAGSPCGTGSGGGGGIVTYSGPALTFITGTQFFPIGGGGVSSTTETNVDVESPAAVTVTNFYVQLSGAVGMGNSVAFTWRKNAADTTLTCTISGASATSCNDTTHSATLAQADLVDIKAVGSGTIVASVTTVMATQFGTVSQGQQHVISFVIDGAGSAIATGALKDFPTANFTCTINKAQISADQSGSITVDIWKAAGAIPNSGNKISASAPVTLSASQLNQNSSLSGWTTSVAVGDVFGFSVATSSTVTHVVGQIWCQ